MLAVFNLAVKSISSEQFLAWLVAGAILLTIAWRLDRRREK
jgi:hypothetical protein